MHQYTLLCCKFFTEQVYGRLRPRPAFRKQANEEGAHGVA